MQTDRSAWITAMINDFVASSRENTLNTPAEEKAFDPPLVGFSTGGDHLYDEYVRHIGDFYLRPIDVFKRAFPEAAPVSPRELTVISWVLGADAATIPKRSSAVMSRTWLETTWESKWLPYFWRHSQVVRHGSATP